MPRRSPENWPGCVGGKPMRALGILNRLRCLPQRNSGRQIERNRHRRHLALVIHGQRSIRRLKMREGRQRHRRSRGRAQINILQGFGSLLELRRNFHDHVILVQRPVHGGNLPLPKGVVESIVQGLRSDPHPAGGVAIDHQLGLQSFILLVGVLVAQFRQGPQLLQQARRPVVQVVRDSRSAACTGTAHCRIAHQS